MGRAHILFSWGLSFAAVQTPKRMPSCIVLDEDPNFESTWSLLQVVARTKAVCVLLCVEPLDVGWAVGGAKLVSKKPETMKECGYSPCNTRRWMPSTPTPAASATTATSSLSAQPSA